MLHLRHLLLTNFATHTHTEVAIPVTGLVAVTGGNGAGKSSLLEAVAAAGWGESLRGEVGWRAGQPGAVCVETDQLRLTRKRSKAGASKLEWQYLDAAPTEYETTSKAQAALEHVIGSYDVWRRTCVLSSADSAAFSLARDADRKRLLEEFLGLSAFDVALDACRKDKREAAAKAQQATSECEKVNLQLSFAQSTLETAKKELAALPAESADLSAMRTEGQRLAQLVKAAEADAQAASARLSELHKQQAEASATLNAEKARLSRLAKDVCVTCGQNVVDMRSHLEREVERLRQEAICALAAIEAEVLAARAMDADLKDELQLLQNKLNNFRIEFRLAEQAAKQRAGLAQKVLDAQNAVAEWAGKVESAQQAAQEAQDRLAHLEAVEQVLGLRGVRAQVLDRSLSALEGQANAWLNRMPTEQGPLVIGLTGTTIQKSGGTVDAISLRVHGRPYASCSGGERRRVDVALLLALRELAVAAHGRDGSLLCDEVFDALDVQGQTDVAAVLAEMARDRAVVVVTHSPDLVRALRPDKHLKVTLETGSAVVRG